MNGAQEEPDTRLRLVLGLCGVGTFEIDPGGDLRLDDGCFAQLGYARSDVHGDTKAWVRDLIHPQDLPTVEHQHAAVADGSLPQADYRVRVLAATGDYLELRCAVGRLGDALLGTLRRVDEHPPRQTRTTAPRPATATGPSPGAGETDPAAPNNLSRLSHELEASRKEADQRGMALQRSNEELDQFAYIVAHDLQAPLRHIRAFVELLRHEHGDIFDETSHEWFERVARSAEHMQQLITDLLAFSRAGRANTPKVPVDLAQLARRVVSELARTANDAFVEVSLEELPTVLGHRWHLHRLFSDLIDNADRYAKPGTRGSLTISARNEDNAWVIDFIDDGIGIDPRFHQKVFEMFQSLSARPVPGSTGIGLAVCRKIAWLHGGDISLRSEAGRGARFSVRLPRPVLAATTTHP